MTFSTLSQEGSSKTTLRRGTADIELMLGTAILVTVLMLVLGAMKIAVARLEMSRTATFEAFENATSDPVPQYTGDGELQPLDGITSVRPGLPNRTHVPRPTKEVSVYAGNKETLPPFKLGARAGLAGPPWAFSAYPVGGQDLTDTQNWFLNYGSESHTWLTDPLRLAPPWTP
jgi:hypothetical protein